MDQEEQAGRPDPQLTLATGRACGGGGARQRGWAGLLAMLVVLCVVVVLAGFVLRQSGLAGGGMQGAAPARVTTGGTGPAAVPEAAPRPLDALGVARGLESTVQQQADAYEKRIDAGVR